MPDESAAIDFEAIATSFRDGSQLAAAIAAANRRLRDPAAGAFTPPRDPTESSVAAIWADVLRLDAVGVHDNFFALGGNSLHMIEIASRVRDEFGVTLPVTGFFDAPTVDMCAREVTRRRAAWLETESGASLLETIEQLSDEDVMAALEGELGTLDRIRAHPDPSGTALRGATAARANAETSADGAAETVAIETIACVTSDRVRAAERALASYAAHCRGAGRTSRLMLIDDSRDAATRESYRAMVRRLADQLGLHLHYAGLEEKRAFAQRLARRADVDAAIVELALLGMPTPSSGAAVPTIGANRNGLLLGLAGKCVLSVDDDTIGALVQPRGSETEPMCVRHMDGGEDPSQTWMFPDRASLLAAMGEGSHDLIGDHQRVLGRRMQAIAGGATDGDLGTVRVSLTGLAGDCGWGSPLPYLTLTGESFDRLTCSEAAYRTALASRELVRSTTRPVITNRVDNLMSTVLALDNRTPLPPFMPMGRGSDIVFARSLVRCVPDAWFAVLPGAVLHDPAEPRRFWAGEVARSAAGLDLCRLIASLIARAPMPPADGDEDRECGFLAIGEYLSEIGALPGGEFRDAVMPAVCAAIGGCIGALEARLDALCEPPAYWAADTRTCIESWRASLQRDDVDVPIDLRYGRSVAEARALTARIVREYGQMFAAWPALHAAARALRHEGDGLIRGDEATEASR